MLSSNVHAIACLLWLSKTKERIWYISKNSQEMIDRLTR